MRTKEFIKKVEELGFRTKSDYLKEKSISIYDIDDYHIADVTTNRLYGAYICGWNSNLTEFEDVIDILSLITEYIITPIEEREEEKRYWLKHSWLGRSDWRYLNILEDGYFFLREGDLIPTLKNTFTLKEIEEIKEKYNTDLSDFEMIEVEE